MAHTLGITGMDSATEDALRSAFEQARPRLGAAWELAPESSAGHVIVDMDSMYGPMSWIRLHAAGKQVIGLTSGARTQADFLLPRPVDADALVALLASIAGSVPAQAVETAAPAAAPAVPAPPAAPMAPEAPPAASTPAPAPADQLPEEQPAPRVDPAEAAPPEPAAALEPVATPAPAAAAETPRERTFADWLAPGALSGRWMLERAGTRVAFDADARTYHGPAALKPLAGLFEGTVSRDDLHAVTPDAWTAAASGEPQSLARLQWLGGLLAGKGTLLPGYDPGGQFRLVKWPQTEREFPRHFRIATAMMKGPATLAETAAASGVPLDEVTDFVNANLATGYAEPALPAPAEPSEPAKPSGGLLGRLRTR